MLYSIFVTEQAQEMDNYTHGNNQKADVMKDGEEIVPCPASNVSV